MKPFIVLIPTDYSEASLEAIDTALELRLRHPDMEITLLHTIEDLPSPADPMVVPPHILEEKLKAARDELDQLAEGYNWSLDISVNRIVEVGHAWQTICQVAKRLNVDFIVMATHGRTGLSRVFMGSVAEKVVRHAPCPVMVIHSYRDQLTEDEKS